MEMQIKLDGQSVTLSMDVKSKVKALSSLRKIPTVNKKIHLDSVDSVVHLRLSCSID